MCWCCQKSRIKEKLRSGEMLVSGDQWPIFLYAGYEYDPENPWKGLFRSTILVCVRFFWTLNFCGPRLIYLVLGLQTRFHISQFSWKSYQGHAVWQCPNSWNDSRYCCFHHLYCYPGELDWDHLCLMTEVELSDFGPQPVGSLRPQLFSCLLQNWHHFWLRTLLPQCTGVFWGCRWARGGGRAFGLVE